MQWQCVQTPFIRDGSNTKKAMAKARAGNSSSNTACLRGPLVLLGRGVGVQKSNAWRRAMKIIASSLLVLGLLAVQISEANAVVCARGVYRAGCAGPRGAVVAHRPYGYGRAAVVRPAYGVRRVRVY
jgi:hypothetical protein